MGRMARMTAMAASLTLAVAVLATPATAAEPVAQCPAGWNLQEMSSVGRSTLIGDAADENGDGWHCSRTLRFARWLPILLVQDNQVYVARI